MASGEGPRPASLKPLRAAPCGTKRDGLNSPPSPPTQVATLAAARQEVTDRVKHSTTACDVKVTPMPLHTTVRGAKKLIAVTIELEVEFTNTATTARPVVGWLFFGFASS